MLNKSGLHLNEHGTKQLATFVLIWVNDAIQSARIDLIKTVNKQLHIDVSKANTDVPITTYSCSVVQAHRLKIPS